MGRKTLQEKQMENKLPENFDWKFYLEYYEDLRNAGLKTKEDAEIHYLNSGQYENRMYFDCNNCVIKMDDIIEYDKSKEKLLKQKNNIKIFTENDYDIIRNHNLNKTKITVLIPLYNYEKFIIKTINSVLSNNFDGVEILIINDNSTDNSLNLVLPFLKTKNNITIINKKINTGVSHTRNLGIEHSIGDYIFMLDADNIIYQDCLIEHYNKIKDTSLIACYGIIEIYDSVDNKIGELSNSEFDIELLNKNNYIDNMAIFNKNKLKEIGNYDLEMMEYGYGWEDYELWLKIGHLGYQVGFINKSLSKYISKSDSLVNVSFNCFCKDLKKYLNKKYNCYIEIDCSKNLKIEIEKIKKNHNSKIEIKSPQKKYELNNKKSLFTITTLDRLSQAKTLGDSFLDKNENYDFIVFLIDNVIENIDIGYKIINISDIKLEEIDSMLEDYEIGEFCYSMKPFCFKYLFENYNFESIVYLDCDIFVFNKLNEIDDDYDIFLTPHNVQTSQHSVEIISIIHGIFNLGFIALKRSENCFNFLDWWSERLKKYCKIDTNNGLFGDQLWINLAIIFFEKIKIIKNIGYNVAYWNLNERKISKIKDNYYVNKDTELVFYHFSGYKFDEKITYHIPKNIDDFSDCVFIFYDYTKRNYINGYSYFNNSN